MPNRPAARHLRKLIHILVVSALPLGLVCLAGLVTVYRASQQVPDFYHEALQQEVKLQEEAGEELEQGVLELHNDVRRQGRWQALFTEQQINGWLAVDLPEKFPNVLPADVREPRVKIAPQHAAVACRYEGRALESIISLALEIYLVEPNVVAVRIRNVRAGVLPLPVQKFLDQIARAAGQADISVSWAQSEGDPVALISVPIEHPEYEYGEISLDTLELRDGELYLAGTTVRSAGATARAAVAQPATTFTSQR